MAARLSPKHDAKTREKIQISQLVNRLMDNALGKVEMTSQQVRSAEILLRKSLPDLSSIEHAGPGGGPVGFLVEYVGPDDEDGAFED